MCTGGAYHDARLMPAKYVRPYSRGQKNDFNDAEAIAEAVQRPTMKFVATSHLVTSATNEKTAPRGFRRIGQQAVLKQDRLPFFTHATISGRMRKSVAEGAADSERPAQAQT